MTSDIKKAGTLLDRSDIRVKHEAGLSGTIRSSIDKVRSGDLGSLPVVVGLVIIWTVFGTLNPTFLSSNNLANLLFDASTVGVISLGIVCVLMVGKIDLSVGSISGFASAMVGMLWVNEGWPAAVAIVAALVVGGLIGSLYALLFNRLGMPSFVSTLAGLLAVAWNAALSAWRHGLDQLALWVGDRELRSAYGHSASARLFFALLPGIVMLVSGYRAALRRREANLSSRSIGGLVARAVAITVALEFVAFYLNQDRGVPWMFALFVALSHHHELCADTDPVGPVDGCGRRQS